MYKKTTALVLGIALTGCASMKPSVHTESTFVIYDVKPATLDRNQFLKAVLDAVQTSASKLRVNREIPPRGAAGDAGALRAPGSVCEFENGGAAGLPGPEHPRAGLQERADDGLHRKHQHVAVW